MGESRPRTASLSVVVNSVLNWAYHRTGVCSACLHISLGGDEVLVIVADGVVDDDGCLVSDLGGLRGDIINPFGNNRELVEGFVSNRSYFGLVFGNVLVKDFPNIVGGFIDVGQHNLGENRDFGTRRPNVVCGLVGNLVITDIEADLVGVINCSHLGAVGKGIGNQRGDCGIDFVDGHVFHQSNIFFKRLEQKSQNVRVRVLMHW